jgi:hypothetical protein
LEKILRVDELGSVDYLVVEPPGTQRMLAALHDRWYPALAPPGSVSARLIV